MNNMKRRTSHGQIYEATDPILDALKFALESLFSIDQLVKRGAHECCKDCMPPRGPHDTVSAVHWFACPHLNMRDSVHWQHGCTQACTSRPDGPVTQCLDS